MSGKCPQCDSYGRVKYAGPYAASMECPKCGSVWEWTNPDYDSKPEGAGIQFDNDNFYVHIHEVSDSKLRLHDGPVYNLLISIITDDKEAIDLTVEALVHWFRERGLS